MKHRKTYRRNIIGAWGVAFVLLLSGFQMKPVLASQDEGAGAEASQTETESPIKAVYQGFFHQTGWSTQKGDNDFCTAPAGSDVTGIKMSLSGQPSDVSGTVSYQVNVSGSGWLPWTENYGETGNTVGEAPLEAIRVMLTGALSEQFDVYYKVFSPAYGQSGSKMEKLPVQKGKVFGWMVLRQPLPGRGAQLPER